jgi:hypothetical protein
MNFIDKIKRKRNEQLLKQIWELIIKSSQRLNSYDEN